MHAWIDVEDGVRLSVDVHLPADHADGVAALVEALPYRKDDVTASYTSSYLRYVDAGFAVVRVDLRGTGSSGGIATDEYPAVELHDLAGVVAWIVDQPWSSGRVGLFGTSYSGFNALQLAAAVDALGLTALGAVVAAYATDDRYTDDVHYCGGVLRALDLIDYPLYMVAMNALPPTPSRLDGDLDSWRSAWLRRVDETPAWLIEWLEHPLDAPTWRRGSIRLGPDGAGYERMGCPTMLIVGWADGYRNNSFRVVEQYSRHGLPWRLLAGPWVHQAPARARPGPNVDDDKEIIAFFDEHLRDGPPSAASPGQVYVREPVAAEPDLAFHPGRWVDLDGWPTAGVRRLRCRSTRSDHERLRVHGDVGVAAWNSCGGALPWGQPLDQRADNARSLCWDWPVMDLVDTPDTVAGTDLLGTASVSLRVSSDRTFGHVSVKLCDVAPDGTSTLITRGMLDLRHVGCWPADAAGEVGRSPSDLVPGEWLDVTIGLEATTWRLVPGHIIRLAVAGTDWPNCWPPPGALTLSVDAGSVVLDLPVVDGLADSTHRFVPGEGPSDDDAEGVEWRIQHDVLARETRVATRYGGTYDGVDGAVVTDDYRGELGVSIIDPASAWARGTSSFEIVWPDVTARTTARLHVESDESELRAEIVLDVWEHDELMRSRTWRTTLPRS